MLGDGGEDMDGQPGRRRQIGGVVPPDRPAPLERRLGDLFAELSSDLNNI
jgi:hypothetical protein